MERKEFDLTPEMMDSIVAINMEGGDPAMYLSGEIPLGRSLTEKIDDLWDGWGVKLGFIPNTVGSVPGSNHTKFTAETI